MFRALYSYNIINDSILNFTSRYFTTMPTFLIGTVVYQYNLFGKTIKQLKVKRRLWISKLILLIVVIIKFFLHFIIKNTSNMDSFYIFFVMFALINFIHEINKMKTRGAYFFRNILKILGKNSLYIWLIHSIFIFEIIQQFTYFLHIPCLILCEVLIISLFFAYVVDKIKSKILAYII